MESLSFAQFTQLVSGRGKVCIQQVSCRAHARTPMPRCYVISEYIDTYEQVGSLAFATVYILPICFADHSSPASNANLQNSAGESATNNKQASYTIDVSLQC